MFAPSNYGWGSDTQRYRDLTTGRFVTPAEVRAEVDVVIQAQREAMPGLVQGLMNGKSTIGGWQEQMEQTIKSMQLANAAAARGGFANLTDADYARISQTIAEQYNYLQQFALQLETGAQPLDGRVLTRANMYMDSARGSYEQTRREGMREVGYDQERRVLGGINNCDDCLAAAGEDWSDIGTLPEIGDSQCGANCNCTFEYQQSEGDQAEA